MVHVSQKIRAENIENVKKLIARTMPNGSRNKELLAVLGGKPYGFAPRTSRQYLEELLDRGEVVWDAEEEVWRLPEK